MKGPHDAVGLKVLLHEQGAVPLVQDFADAVPAGMNTFIAVDVMRVSETTPSIGLGLFVEPQTHYCVLLVVTDLSFPF